MLSQKQLHTHRAESSDPVIIGDLCWLTRFKYDALELELMRKKALSKWHHLEGAILWVFWFLFHFVHLHLPILRKFTEKSGWERQNRKGRRL